MSDAQAQDLDETPGEEEGKASRLKYEVPTDPILITGATSGIGRALARIVAERQAPLIVHARDRTRGEALLEELKPLAGDASLELVIADLAEQKEVRAMAAEVNAKHKSLHALINNAGVIMGERILTDEGVEITLAVNHVAPFMLIREFSDALANNGGGRVVNLNSFLHKRALVDFDDLNGEKFFEPMTAYANAKMLNLWTTYAWARRLLDKKVMVNAYNPGMVRTRMLGGGLVRIFAPLIAKGPRTAAATAAFMAMSPKLDGASGGYYVATGALKPSSNESGDEELQEKAFAATEGLLKTAVGG